ncbi:MAG: DNA polymerase III subunit chi [Alphaproteobacteria bacterium]|nr:DNA polymerase III subunit chi [Alphaproteobacteria bacterium]
MTEVLFYHLEHKPLDVVLPELLEKCFERDWKVYIQCQNKTSAQKIDKQLWSYKADSFLPHGLDDAPQGQRKNFSKEEYAQLQPILIGAEAHNPNSSSVRFLLEGSDVESDDIAQYQRVIVMFDGASEDAVATARQQWKKFKALPADILSAITYWQQGASGRWEKMA